MSYGDPMAYTSTGYVWFVIPAELGWSKPLILQLDGSLGLHCALILFGVFDMLGQPPWSAYQILAGLAVGWINMYIHIYIYTHYIWVVSCNPPSRYLLMIARCHYLLSLLLLAGHLALGCWLFIQSSWWMLTKKSHRIPWVARSYTLQLVFHSPQKYSFCCITCHVCWQPPNSCWSKTLFAGCCFVAQSRNISDLFRLIQWQLKFLIDVETPFADHFPRVSPWVFHICPHLR